MHLYPMSLYSTNYTGYHAGFYAIDLARPWEVIRRLQPNGTALGEVVSQHATKKAAIAAILDFEVAILERKGGAN